MSQTVGGDGPVLVVGASGNCGREIVRQLREQGRTVRAMTRFPEKAATLEAFGAEVVQGDLLDRESLRQACEGMSQVVASAHAALSRGKYRPQTVDGQGQHDLIDVAREAAVKHFVYVSAIGIAPDHPIDFFRIKYGTEQYLKSSGLPYSIVRGAAFMETQNDIHGEAFLKNGKFFLFGRGDKASNYVSVIDVARFVVLALRDERLNNRLVEVGGPENLTVSQVVDIYERITGRKGKRKHIPILVLRTLRLLVGPFHSVARRMFSMGVLLGTKAWPHDMSPMLQEFPGGLTRFETVVEAWYRGKRDPVGTL